MPSVLCWIEIRSFEHIEQLNPILVDSVLWHSVFVLLETAIKEWVHFVIVKITSKPFPPS